MQVVYNPADFCFAWTTDDSWYTWDRDAAHLYARTVRDAHARELKAEGHKVKKFTLPNQLITRGGIGTGCPQIEMIVTGYGIIYS